MRALCVPQGAPQPLQEELGPSETGTSEHCDGQVRPFGGSLPFFCSHLLAMHVAGRVKTSALLTGDI